MSSGRTARAFVLAWMTGAALAAQGGFAPARFRDGSVPGVPATPTGGGEVLLELAVNSAGRVTAVRPLRVTPPFTDAVSAVARGWRFDPAARSAGAAGQNGRQPVDTRVLVAAVYRPPALAGPVLATAPQDVARPSPEVPYPLGMSVPAFPPNALSAGTVLVEAQVDARGTVASARTVFDTPPFGDAALDATERWRFQPARREGTPVATFVYILFGFPVPVTVPGAPTPGR
jgi:TonB family protein